MIINILVKVLFITILYIVSIYLFERGIKHE